MNKLPSDWRNQPAHYTPAALPAELLNLHAPLHGLAVGAAGKVGLLELTFAPVAGKTRIIHQFHQMPLHLFRALYPDPQRADMAYVYMLSPGGGIVQGDRLRIDLVCEAGAAVHITTQAATKLYRMQDNFATQWINITARAGALVEYLPDPIIPFAGARFFQQTRLTVAPEATVILGETLYPGRVAHDERFAYDLFYSRCEAERPDGELLFADLIHFDPGRQPLDSPGRLGAYDYLSTLYIISRVRPAHDLARTLHHLLDGRPDTISGVSALPNQCGVVVRILGASSRVVERALHLAWSAARQQLIGAEAPPLRKY
jgi:urease accessory protein